MTELRKQRIRVTFDLDVIVDDGKITNSGNDDEIKGYDLALLQQFLQQSNPDKLQEMLAYQAALFLGWQGPDEIETMVMGHEITQGWERAIFSSAIDVMEGTEGEYWRETRDMPPDKRLGDVLGMCTESIWACFDVRFSGARVECYNAEIIGENEASEGVGRLEIENDN